MAFTKSGKPYYRNDHDQSTSWDKPTEASDHRTLAVASSKGKGRRQEQSRPAKSGSREERETRTEASDHRGDTGGSMDHSSASSRATNGRPTKASPSAANLPPGSPLPSGAISVYFHEFM